MKSRLTRPASDTAVSSLQRAVALLRALGGGASRVSEVSKTLGYTQATTHRLLQRDHGGVVERAAVELRGKREPVRVYAPAVPAATPEAPAEAPAAGTLRR